MIKIRLSLKERAAAGLITGYSAGRFDWYMTRHAARCIRDARAYPPQQARKGKPWLTSLPAPGSDGLNTYSPCGQS
jgi:hypothetical protein